MRIAGGRRNEARSPVLAAWWPISGNRSPPSRKSSARHVTATVHSYWGHVTVQEIPVLRQSARIYGHQAIWPVMKNAASLQRESVHSELTWNEPRRPAINRRPPAPIKAGHLTAGWPDINGSFRYYGWFRYDVLIKSCGVSQPGRWSDGPTMDQLVGSGRHGAAARSISGRHICGAANGHRPGQGGRVTRWPGTWRHQNGVWHAAFCPSCMV